MAHAEKCPVCEGKGKVEEKQCHGCSGLGWVTVQKQFFTYPVVIYPQPQPVYPEWPQPNEPFYSPYTTTGGEMGADNDPYVGVYC